MLNENPESPYSQGGHNPLYQEPEIPDFELQALLPGMVFAGKYRLIETAQRAGRGEVWKALDTVLEQEVALKFLPLALRRDETAINAMRTAVQSIRQLAHPAICPVYALEQDERFGCYTVMKWLDGFTLREFLDEKRKFRMSVSLDVVRDILRRVAETLDFVHSYSVSHGNVHPQKIFLNLDNGRLQELFLMDFGSRTEGGLPYLAPEIRHGAPSGAKSDQYSLAVMAYELLSGRLPFPQDQTNRWLNSGPEPFQPESFSAGHVLGEAEQNAVQNALMMAFSDSSVRYPSCMAFVEALEQALDSKEEIAEVLPETPTTTETETETASEVVPPMNLPPVTSSVTSQETVPFRFSPITPSGTQSDGVFSQVTLPPVTPPVVPPSVTPPPVTSPPVTSSVMPPPVNSPLTGMFDNLDFTASKTVPSPVTPPVSQAPVLPSSVTSSPVMPPPIIPDFTASVTPSAISETETLASLDFSAPKPVVEKEKVPEKPEFNIFGENSEFVSASVTLPSVTPPVVSQSVVSQSVVSQSVVFPPSVTPPPVPVTPPVTPPPIPTGMPESLPFSSTEPPRKYAPMTVKGKGLPVRTKNGKGTKNGKNWGLLLKLLLVAAVGGGIAVFLQTSDILGTKTSRVVNHAVETDVNADSGVVANLGNPPENQVVNPPVNPVITPPVKPGEAGNGNAVQNQVVAETKPFQSPDFASIRLNLEQMKLREAQNLVDRAKDFNMTPEDKARLKRLEDTVMLATQFMQGVKRDLERYEPPMELCQGEFGLVESSPERVVIRIGGQNVHFSMKDPIKGGQNLYEILYRHHALKAIPVGNLQPTLTYSAFLLVSPYGDRQKARQKATELLKLVEEKGNPTNREMAQGLKVEFQL